MSHIDARVAGRALDALPPAESAQVDRHVDVCPACRRVLHEAQETAHLLTLVVHAARPPRHCKARVMERIAREDVRRRAARRHLRAPTRIGWAVAGALALVALLLVAWNVRRQRTLNALRLRVGDCAVGMT